MSMQVRDLLHKRIRDSYLHPGFQVGWRWQCMLLWREAGGWWAKAKALVWRGERSTCCCSWGSVESHWSRSGSLPNHHET